MQKEEIYFTTDKYSNLTDDDVDKYFESINNNRY